MLKLKDGSGLIAISEAAESFSVLANTTLTFEGV